MADDVRADVRDYEAVRDTLAAAQPEIVLHLAAQPFVRRSFVDPRTTYETNVMGTVNVLEAVRATPSVRVAIAITTDKCYDNDPARPPRPFVETDPMGGHDPYSSSKGCAELVVDAYRRSFFEATAGQRRGAHRVGSRGQRHRRRRLGRGPPRARLHARRARGPRHPSTQPRRRPAVAARAQPAVGLPAARRGAARLGRAPGRLELRPRARRRAQRERDRRPRERAVARRAALGDRSRPASARGALPRAGLRQGPRAARLGARVGPRRGARGGRRVVPRAARRRGHARGDAAGRSRRSRRPARSSEKRRGRRFILGSLARTRVLSPACRSSRSPGAASQQP